MTSDAMSGTIEKYLIEIREATSKPGIYAYRGQADSQWPLHSAATRRLINERSDALLDRADFPKDYLKYHRETLLEPARARGFDVEDGRKVSDLQLLAKLQHFRAATGLLDFTWSPLVALWFAIEDLKCNGKLFIIKTDDPLNVALISSDEEEQRVEAIFSHADNSPRLSYWEPRLSGDAVSRILRQRSVFIIGRPLIPEDTEIIREIEIAKDDKASLLKDLALLDVSQLSLFQDVYGFAEAESASSPLRQTHDPDDYLLQGNQFYQRGDYLKAIEAYGKCIELAPNAFEPYFLRGNAKQLLGRHKDAVADFDEVIRRKPDLADAYNNRGVAKAELGRHEAALPDYEEAIHLKSDNANAYNNRGNAKQALGRYGEAIADYDRAIDLKPDLADAYNNRGVAKTELKQYKQAIADCDKAIDLKPDYAEAYYNRGRAKAPLGRHEAALPDYEEAIRLKPHNADAYNNRGNAKQALGRYDEAIADYDRAIDLKPDYTQAYINRSKAKVALGLEDEARKDLETALELAQNANNTEMVVLVEELLHGLDADGDDGDS